MDKRTILRKTSSFLVGAPKKSTPDPKDSKEPPPIEERVVESRRGTRGGVGLRLEPMEPASPFRPEPVHDLLTCLLHHFLHDITYDPYLAAELCLYMSGLIRDLVKKFKFDRYKLVAIVEIVEKNHQGVRTVSHCLWDNERDGMVTARYDQASFTCGVAVFATYCY